MKNSKTLYVIRTSEDGNIGVATNKKKAFEAVKNYFDMSWADETPKDYYDNSLSYSNVCKALRGSYGVTYEAGGIDVEIEVFRANRF